LICLRKESSGVFLGIFPALFDVFQGRCAGSNGEADDVLFLDDRVREIVLMRIVQSLHELLTQLISSLEAEADKGKVRGEQDLKAIVGLDPLLEFFRVIYVLQ
jgi:hypothetical protein